MKKSFSLKACLLLIASGSLFSSVMDYPTAAIDRPGTTPVGMYIIDADLNFKTLKKPVFEFSASTGIAKHMHVSLAYSGFALNDFSKFEAGKIFTLGYKYSYWSSSFVATGLELSLPFHVYDGEIVRKATLGLPVTFFNKKFAGGFGSDIFTWHMRPKIAFDFNFPVWFGAQVWGDLWMDISTNLAKVTMTNKNNQAEWGYTGIWEETPVRLRTTYGINHQFDVNANVGFADAMKFKESFTVGLGFEFRG